MKVFRRTREKSAGHVEARIRAALDEMRPLLRVESFTVELADFDSASGTANLRVDGGCPDCDMTPATLLRAIEAHLRQRVPEVETVRSESPVR